MTLPSSGALSISQIAAEFGVSLPCAFPSAFYGKPGVPGSGTLTLPDSFYGLSNQSFNPDGGAVDGSAIGEAATVTLYANPAAVWTYSGGGTGGFVNVPSGNSATSITFSCVPPGVGARVRNWTVTGTIGGLVRNFTVSLSAEA